LHPIFASYARLGLYLAIWIPAAALVTIELATVGALPWGVAAAVAVPLSD
jgi:hypothetical protein